MTWSTFYLICFVLGLASIVLLLLGGMGRFHIGVHGHGAWSHAGRVGVQHGGPAHTGTGAAISYFNFFSLVAFLTWFGGTGYLLSRYGSFWFLFALLLATASGLAGSAVIFWFLAKVLLAHETYLDAADFELVGMVGRIGSPIRQGGTGEIIFSQAGARKASGARSEDGSAIGRGAEVVITRYERGIAYVRRWDDLTR